MKKILVFAAAALTFFACKNPEPVNPPEPEDKVTLSAEEKTFGVEGGSLQVIVTSSADWTLTSAEDYTWVTPSATTGSDGDIVKFTVSANDSDADREATFTFTVGEAHADLVITSLAKELVKIEVAETDVVLDYNKGELNLIVTSEIEYRDLQQTVKILSGDDNWLRFTVALPGDEANTSKLVFAYDELASLDDRNATITVTGPDAVTVEVNVLQEAKHVLATDKEFYTVPMEGGSIVVPVTANVEYKIEIAQEGNWLTVGEATAEGIPFTATTLSGDKRVATVTFTQTDAKDGEEALVATISISQMGTLISWAAEMTTNRLFPKWDGTAARLGVANAITYELLFCADNFNNSITTLMGIEGMFLLRCGDSAPKNVLQIATLNGNLDVPLVAGTSAGFETNRWYHVAVTYEMDASYQATVKAYIDGELKAEKSGWSMSKYVGWPLWTNVYGVDFSPNWSYEGDAIRCVWMGYSYDDTRYLAGKMTEIRIWNKVLTEEEINAENHFYTVDPQSEGLYAYWKFEAGTGNTIEDATGNGNKLYGELGVAKQANDANYGEEGIKWVEVSLPEK